MQCGLLTHNKKSFQIFVLKCDYFKVKLWSYLALCIIKAKFYACNCHTSLDFTIYLEAHKCGISCAGACVMFPKVSCILIQCVKTELGPPRLHHGTVWHPAEESDNQEANMAFP